MNLIGRGPAVLAGALPPAFRAGVAAFVLSGMPSVQPFGLGLSFDV